MKGVELFHISSKNFWEEVRATVNEVIILMYNSSTSFTNSLLSNVEISNNGMISYRIIVGGRWRNNTTRAPTWSGQLIWGTNNFYIAMDSMNIRPCLYSRFSLVVRECDKICHLGWNACLEFIYLLQCLHVLEENVFRRWIIYIEDNFLLKSENYATKSFKLLSVLECQGS